LHIPLIAVGSLDALAEVAAEDYEAGIIDVESWENAILMPMVDARRMEVYTQMFSSDVKPLSEVSAEVITAESFAQQRAEHQVIIFGNGAAKCRELMADATFINITPSARGLARLAQERFDAGQTEDIAYFEPFYLKDFVVIPSKKKLL
jgi:tRNA threonylcarbamoyladenosine biosynthesis protein TsaB